MVDIFTRHSCDRNFDESADITKKEGWGWLTTEYTMFVTTRPFI